MLRRKGRPPGAGDPPGSGIDSIVGIKFEIRTLIPQIEKASQEIDEQFKLAEILARNPNSALTPDDLLLISDITVCKVLERRYMGISRGTEIPGAQEVFMVKSQNYARRIEELASRITLRLTTGETVVSGRKLASRIFFG